MSKINRLHFFSAVTFATALILITPHDIKGATGRSGNYSLLSGHGGYNTDGKGVSRLPGYSPGNCAHCHEQHASVGGSEPPPVNSAPSGYLLFDELVTNTFCVYCHNSTQSNGADNIAQQITKASAHDPNSATSTVLCIDCHNAHEATPVRHKDLPQSGVGNTASGVLQGVKGVNLTSGSWPGAGSPAAGNEIINPPLTLPALDPITFEYQLCFKCHGGQIAGLADMAGQFNPGNSAVHPVTTSTWKNTFLWSNAGTAMKTPWQTSDTQMYCSDCHASNSDTDPVGPHGSTNIYLLRAAGPGASLDNLCNTCHNVSGASGASNWVSEAPVLGYSPNRDHDFGSHQYPANGLGCIACHGGVGDAALESSIHGANHRGAVNNVGTDTGRMSKAFLFNTTYISKIYYTDNSNGEAIDDVQGNRYCAATCHATDGGIGHRF